jgi:hypothetical protein
VFPTIIQVPKKVAKELLLFNSIIPRWIATDSDNQWLRIRRILEAMKSSFRQANNWIGIAGLLHYPPVGGICCGWLVPDSCPLLYNEVLGLKKVKVLGRVEE